MDLLLLLGLALFGRKAGDTVTYSTPGGELHVALLGAGLDQVAHQLVEQHVGLVDFLDLYRAKRFHVLAQHVGAALRHASENLRPQLVAGAFERHCQ